MEIKNVCKSATTLYYKGVGKIKKNSPTILVCMGVVGVVGGTVWACVQSTKLKDILDENKNNIEEIKKKTDNTVEEVKKEITKEYAKTSLKVIKLYYGPVIVSTISIGSIIASNNILNNRNIALSAAYATIDTAYKKYRKEVIDRFGEDVDTEIRHAMVLKNSTTEKNDSNELDISICNADTYTALFDECSSAWMKDANANRIFLEHNQVYMNNILVTRGYVFLNEVCELLCIPKTPAGQVVGWYYNKDHQSHINFGMFDMTDKTKLNFLNGDERSIWLNFNVDGNILDKI